MLLIDFSENILATIVEVGTPGRHKRVLHSLNYSINIFAVSVRIQDGVIYVSRGYLLVYIYTAYIFI